MFIKRGDGKIMSVFDENELTDKQKQAVEIESEKIIKKSNDLDDSDLSNTDKKLGR